MGLAFWVEARLSNPLRRCPTAVGRWALISLVTSRYTIVSVTGTQLGSEDETGKEVFFIGPWEVRGCRLMTLRLPSSITLRPNRGTFLCVVTVMLNGTCTKIRAPFIMLSVGRLGDGAAALNGFCKLAILGVTLFAAVRLGPLMIKRLAFLLG